VLHFFGGIKGWFLLKQVGWFSFDPEFHVEREQMCCYLTRTTKETHQIVIDNLDETPTYGGWVEAKGPRYCPAIEDKVLYNGPCWFVTWQSSFILIIGLSTKLVIFMQKIKYYTYNS